MRRLLTLLLLFFLILLMWLSRRALSLGVWIVGSTAKLVVVVVSELGDVFTAKASVFIT